MRILLVAGRVYNSQNDVSADADAFELAIDSARNGGGRTVWAATQRILDVPESDRTFEETSLFEVARHCLEAASEISSIQHAYAKMVHAWDGRAAYMEAFVSIAGAILMTSSVAASRLPDEEIARTRRSVETQSLAAAQGFIFNLESALRLDFAGLDIEETCVVLAAHTLPRQPIEMMLMIACNRLRIEIPRGVYPQFQASAQTLHPFASKLQELARAKGTLHRLEQAEEGAYEQVLSSSARGRWDESAPA